MTDRDKQLAVRARNRDEFAVAMDADEMRSMLSTKDQSALGLSHELCEHHRTRATCELCIYGEAGNKVIIDMGAYEYAERVNHRKETGQHLDPVKIAEEAFRAGAASGISMQREAPVALAVVGSREGKTGDDVAIGVLLALRDGRISKVEALASMNRWAEGKMKELATEADPHGLRQNALTSAD